MQKKWKNGNVALSQISDVATSMRRSMAHKGTTEGHSQEDLFFLSQISSSFNTAPLWNHFTQYWLRVPSFTLELALGNVNKVTTKSYNQIAKQKLNNTHVLKNTVEVLDPRGTFGFMF